MKVTKDPKFKIGDRIKYDVFLSGKVNRYVTIDKIDIDPLDGKYRYWGIWEHMMHYTYVKSEGNLSLSPLENPPTEQKKHKYSELIKAWADGAIIQYKASDKWKDVNYTPAWDINTEYRIKPKEIEVVTSVGYYTTIADTLPNVWLGSVHAGDNLKLTFNPDTHKLVKAEVIE